MPTTSNENDGCASLLICCAMMSVAFITGFTLASIAYDIRPDAVRRGYARWVPNERGETVFEWIDSKREVSDNESNK